MKLKELLNSIREDQKIEVIENADKIAHGTKFYVSNFELVEPEYQEIDVKTLIAVSDLIIIAI